MENVNIYTTDKDANLTGVDIANTSDFEALKSHLQRLLLPHSELRDISIVAYSKLTAESDIWLQYRSDKLLLRISAEDSVAAFRDESERAKAVADDVVALAIEIATSNEKLREFVGRFRGRVTFFRRGRAASLPDPFA